MLGFPKHLAGSVGQRFASPHLLRDSSFRFASFRVTFLNWQMYDFGKVIWYYISTTMLPIGTIG
ncbi:MAG: hypothetical protein H6616_01925 [Ignavibacteria bacterium]|nr:hypothetical protein [Ignavibacteria bacterium]